MYLRDRSVHWSYTQHVLHSCTVYRLYTCKVAVHKLVKRVWKLMDGWMDDDDDDGKRRSVELVH